ncbi:MAG TPA: hypothetical protein VFD03_04310 [Clostridia bacterium]|nr:hypothetical protein [Clostridia bacterium]
MNEFDINRIIGFFLYWKEVWLILFGALISTIISSIFSRKRQNQLLRIDLQVKTSRELIQAIKEVSDRANGIMFPSFIWFNNYNNTLQNFKPTDEQLNPYNKFVNQFVHDQIENSKAKARESYIQYNDLWIEYYKSFFVATSILEANEVILSKFVGIRNLLFDEMSDLSEMYNEFADLYHSNISSNITYSKQIDAETLKRVDDFKAEIMKKCIDINCIFGDLQVGLQNEFMSKLFKYTVPYRQPKDKSYQVYKPDFIYERKKEFAMGVTEKEKEESEG